MKPNINIETPYYFIDEKKIFKNLKKISWLKEKTGVKVVLALKCFSTWSVFGLLREYLDGTTSSSLYETRLGYEKFGKETHAYCVGYTLEDIKEIKKYSNIIIFNSISQLKRFYKEVKGLSIGIRINPKVSYSQYDLADPARKFSRLGVIDKNEIKKIINLIDGVMFHFNCENDNFENFSNNLDYISKEFEDILHKMKWVSLGGGIYFTKKGYPLNEFAKKLKSFIKKFKLQVYLEPGESVVTEAAELVTKVVDIVHNEIDIAIVDASTEPHMLDLLIYGTPAKIKSYPDGKYRYMIAGRSCLAGDIFGVYNFRKKLKVGDIIRIQDAAGYTMVKKNWFNGLQMPSIVVKRLNGNIEVVRKFTYEDYLYSLS
ncbi:MAG: carboxynorspermidine decarboxylase [Elusimicrobiota bacterium]|nr:carboxynorspermidine decarboxylase [Endomicrobiia bacterium]MDW8164930.1 carboxynorspermidine decarboxylase [Elusimicrobiota bacterium]